MYSSAFVPSRPNPAPTASTCTKGGLYSRPRRVCGGATSSIPMQGLAKPSQICNQSFTCESHQPSAYVLLRLLRIFILRGIFIVMGELYCNSAVFCYLNLFWLGRVTWVEFVCFSVLNPKVSSLHPFQERSLTSRKKTLRKRERIVNETFVVSCSVQNINCYIMLYPQLVVKQGKTFTSPPKEHFLCLPLIITADRGTF